MYVVTRSVHNTSLKANKRAYYSPHSKIKTNLYVSIYPPVVIFIHIGPTLTLQSTCPHLQRLQCIRIQTPVSIIISLMLGMFFHIHQICEFCGLIWVLFGSFLCLFCLFVFLSFSFFSLLFFFFCLGWLYSHLAG